MNLLLFAGTTEGRRLAERLCGLPVRATVCVATEYGGDLLALPPERFSVLAGRMDAEAMRELMRGAAFDLAIDATHPYAEAVSKNIRRAAGASGVPYLRLLREESGGGAEAEYVRDAEEAAARLAASRGNVLLATGVKDLHAYAAVPGFADRMYPRVLPSEESIRRCLELGYRPGNLIAMQGPFSLELNLALMRQFSIGIMVTKDGGAAGGFPEKIAASERAGVGVIVIGRPPEAEGLSPEAVWNRIVETLEGGA